jgi:tetratricopeptide (TPR) repeat protein
VLQHDPTHSGSRYQRGLLLHEQALRLRMQTEFLHTYDVSGATPATRDMPLTDTHEADLLDQAYNDFSEIISQDPAHISAYYQRSRVAVRCHNLAAARTDLQRVLNLQPDHADALYERARIAMYEHQWKAALADLTAFLERHPTHAEAYLLRARIYRELQDGAQAHADLERAIAANSRYVALLQLWQDLVRSTQESNVSSQAQ